MGRNNNNSGNFLQVVANNLDVLALPLVTLVYPLYASIRAIETKSRTDDQQWLTYWVLYSLMTIFELTFAKVLECLPVWTYAKLIFTCWLVLPQFNGAAYVYRRFIRPYYMNPQTAHQMWYFPRKKGAGLFSKPDDVLTAAEKYMEENGTDAFERLISKVDRERTSRKSNNYMIFDDDYMY
ncbi:HVA22-like protein c [Pyrus communis]|uniref:HVA22-like protein c n=1 Tax=Pyrus communis TaxID=23211 RepID=UPI0035BF5F70